MRQIFKVKTPIPSFELHSLEYENGEWAYCYDFDLPEQLTDEKRKEPFYSTGFFVKRKFVRSLGQNLIGLEVFCKQDIYDLMEEQRQSDIRFRNEFKKSHLANNLVPFTFTLENKSQRAVKKWIASEVSNDGKNTTFTGRIEGVKVEDKN